MPQHIAFLRAINVGGHIVKMEALRGHCTSLGLCNVRTFIQSGNVIFDSSLRPAALESSLETHLAGILGYEVDTFIRSLDEVREAATEAESRFAGPLSAGAKVYVAFLRALPPAESQQRTVALSNEIDILSFGKRELYWLGYGGQAESTITGPRLAKALGTSTTTRNLTSLKKLIAMCGKPS